MKTIQIIIKGQVQGVFYRQSAREKAGELGVVGTIMNMPDGSVLSIATGTDAQLEVFLNWCRRGPSAAEVAEIFYEELPLKEFKNFEIKR